MYILYFPLLVIPIWGLGIHNAQDGGVSSGCLAELFESYCLIAVCVHFFKEFFSNLGPRFPSLQAASKHIRISLEKIKFD